ncbi:stage III sporulation protein AG [Heyndrickxia acidiproducens]|uniref:stage III sporulation protein AG n=1 Tax=Heyndrickxia acidiproducens TaxID=1121084 RepID=UPI000379CE3B|nr:stage III sporulation protein AG [Heyndrickxia acidiproducens]
MDHKQGPLDRLKEKWLSRAAAPDGPKKNKKLAYIMMIFVCGLGVMLISDLFTQTGKKDTALPAAATETQSSGKKEVETFAKNTSKKSKSIIAYQDKYEKELKNILEQITGVGTVKVQVNVATSESKVYEKNTTIQNETTTENDKNGGERKIESISKDDKVVTVQDGEKEVPLITETKMPEVTGVLVVCDGGGSVSIQKDVKEAVSNALNVASYRVSVMPKKK